MNISPYNMLFCAAVLCSLAGFRLCFSRFKAAAAMFAAACALMALYSLPARDATLFCGQAFFALACLTLGDHTRAQGGPE